MKRRLLFVILTIAVSIGTTVSAQTKDAQKLVKKITHTDGFVALWDFSEPSDSDRYAKVSPGKNAPRAYPLSSQDGIVKRVGDGPLSGYAAHFDGKAFLSLPNSETGVLNITSPGVTVIGWVRWEGSTGFVGGMWNEYLDGGKRQYGLFVSLPHYNGANQVCGHISRTGKPTPPFPYSCDYSASAQEVPRNRWCCVAFTYDGEYIRSYLNGEFEERPPERISNTQGFDGYPDGLTHAKNPYYFPDGMGDNGSDFTVGAVLLKRGMGNFFLGEIGGLAVFNRALTPEEMARLAVMPN